MSGFSTHAGVIRRAAGYPGNYAPIGPIVGRDYAVNNANHYADIFGQVRANWMATSTTYLTSDVGSDGAWEPMWYGQRFPIALRPDGSSYRLRVRVCGACSNAAFKVKFAVTLAAPGSTYTVYPGTSTSDAVWTVTNDVASTSAAWLAGTSNGSENWTRMVALDATEAAACMRNTASLADIAGAPTDIYQCLVQPVVWAYVEDAAHQARLYGVDLEEFPG